jgi:hypothetical protein
VFTEDEILNARYRGMNPAFVRRVWEKQRAQEHEQLIKERERRLQEKEQARIRNREAVNAMRTEMRGKMAMEREAKKEKDEIARRMAQSGVVLDDIEIGITGREIIERIARKAEMTYDDIIGPSRGRRLVAVRHRAMIEVYIRKPALSLVQIGRLFKRDHTTIIHALDKAGVKRSAAT